MKGLRSAVWVVAFLVIVLNISGCDSDGPTAPPTVEPPAGYTFSMEVTWTRMGQPIRDTPVTVPDPALVLVGANSCLPTTPYDMTGSGDVWKITFDEPIKDCLYFAKVGWALLRNSGQTAAWNIDVVVNDNGIVSSASMTEANTHWAVTGCNGDDPAYWVHAGKFQFRKKDGVWGVVVVPGSGPKDSC